MKIVARTPLRAVAFAVGDALRRAGIDATLTGGSCATVYSHGAYQSLDIDYVVRSAVRQRDLDAVMSALGYTREGGRYVHHVSPYYIEFVAGPLAVGDDAQVAPVTLRAGRAAMAALSPTDACRDRLAAFYHWHDRPSLDAAVAIARRQRVNMKTIEQWSRKEGAVRQFDLFRAAARRQVRRRSRSPRRF